MAGGDIARIGEAGLAGDLRVAVEDDDLVAVLGQVPGGGDPHHPAAEDDDFHYSISGRRRR